MSSIAHSGLAAMAGPAERSLDGVAVFRDLSAEARAKVASRCRWRQYDARSEIVGYQDPTNDVFFIVRGRVRVIIYSSSGRAVTFRDLGPGQMFGEVAAIDGQRRSASIEALESCLIAHMTPAVFWDVVLSEPTVARAVLLHLTGLVRSVSTRVYEFSTLAVQNRIHAELLRLARDGEAAERGVLISHPPTHTEIASRISTHREAVTRELNRLAKLGIVERHGTALLVTDLDRLIRMVADATGE
jgi:CRP/FNR family cyclic AMP-dependent transcriptional regulator